MEYIKIISRIDSEEAVKSAEALAAAGADELFFLYESEQDLEIIKEITGKIDTPVCVRLTPERFEDVKKVLYAGAAAVCLVQTKEEVVREVIGRFGREKVAGVLSEEMKNTGDTSGLAKLGYGQCCFQAEIAGEEETRKIKALCGQSSIPVVACFPDKLPEMEPLGAWIKETGIRGVVLPPAAGLRTKEIKQALNRIGIPVNTFGSAIPFSEFKRNEDGLIPVVVQDYKTNQVLMVAYMNEEAYDKTVRTGQMTYYSRSRKSLWLKGETSGHFQYVKSLMLDCDKDTILAKVEQIGAACHTGSYSCFFRELVKHDYHEGNPLTVLMEDYAVIAERKKNPREGSYTNYLFDKGIDKILKKIGEEATEIVIAAKNPETGELKYEISDFLYHMMVLMVEQGLTWEDITEELARRR